ncbi:hypothetical protein, partial [Nonomuraea lactucae]|uniref:hypothetical protein n=1 Tax=Nonomuraea lactucae TaxID=2249762 RepID=UPI001964BC66
AELDLAALRRARRRPGLGNLLSRVKTRLWAEEYGRHDVDRPGGLAASAGGTDGSDGSGGSRDSGGTGGADGTVRDRAWFAARQAEAIERLHG